MATSIYLGVTMSRSAHAEETKMSEQRSLASVIKSLRAVRSAFVLMFLLGLGAVSLTAPASAVMLSEDDIVVVDRSANAVFRIDIITGSATTVVSGSTFSEFLDVAVEADGNILQLRTASMRGAWR